MTTGRIHGTHQATRFRRIVAGAGIAGLALTCLPVAASHADPSIDDVQTKVDALYRKSEAAQERLNDVRSQMGDKQDRLESLKRDLKRQRADVRKTGDLVAEMIADQAQSNTLGATSQLLLSDDPEEFLDGVAASEAFNRHQGELLTELDTKSEQLELREGQVKAELADLAADRRQIAKEQETVDDNLAEAKDLLARLKEEERQRLAREAAAREAAAREAAAQAQAQVDNGSQGGTQTQGETVSRGGSARQAPSPAPAAPPASGRAATAVQFALAQVGDAYVYGAAGPSAWDCSGLTMGAWGAAGVSLPHSSSGQMGYGTPVSSSNLQPGDLVFYYSPVHHVGIYIGNGQIVHAANPSQPVNIAPVFSMPFSGAVRPG